jgi:hypothetical protein
VALPKQYWLFVTRAATRAARVYLDADKLL